MNSLRSFFLNLCKTLVISVLLAGCDNGANQLKTSVGKVKNKNNKMVELYVYNKGSGGRDGQKYKDDQQLHFRIPIDYLEGWPANKRGGEQDYIWIRTNLINLEPNNKVITGVSTEEFSKNVIAITIERHKSNRLDHDLNLHAAGKRKRLSRSLEKVEKKINDTSIIADVYVRQENKYDLEHYLSLHCRFYKKMTEQQLINYKKLEFSDHPNFINDGNEDRHCRYRDHEYFITPINYEKSFVYVDCEIKRFGNSVNRQGCKGYFRYKQWSAKYFFYGSQLHRWQEIDAKVRRLLNRYWMPTPKHKS